MRTNRVDPAVQAIQEALKAIVLVRKAAQADTTAARLELLSRAETALYESAWQTRCAAGREHDRLRS